MTIRLKTSLPGPRSKELMEKRKAHVARGPFHNTPIFAAKAHGVWIEDVDGNQILDFASGIGVVNLGHTPEKLSAAIKQQADLLIHSSFNVVPYENYVSLAEKLNTKTPGTFKKKSFLANSGAEAVENSIKIARAYTGRAPIVCFEHAFHGRTYMAMSLTYKDKPYKAGFGPFNNDIYRSAYPYAYRWNTSSDPARVSHECFAQFENLVKTQMSEKPAAVIIEPILGEGGFVPAPKEFLAMLSKYCTENGIVLIADEIQSGFGRTGTLFACEQLELVPDLLLTAKGLGGGMPIAAVTGRAEIMDAPSEGGIGGTFGGNPVSCAAALAVFDCIEKDNILKNAKELGASLEKTFSRWKEQYPVLGDTRGLGTMRALEFVKDQKTKEAFPEAAKRLVPYCYERGLVIMTAGSQGNIVRILVPLTMNQEELNEGLKILEAGIKEIKL